MALAGLVVALGVSTVGSAAAAEDRRVVDVVQVSGYLDPITVDFVEGALADAEAADAEAFVIQLDSPGAVVDGDVLDELLARLTDSTVPVAVWVGQTGAEASGDAARLVLEAPIAGMAPGTKLSGDALPPEADGSAGPDEAERLGLVDLNSRQAAVLGNFLRAIDGLEAAGRSVETSTSTPDPDGGAPNVDLDVEVRLSKLPFVSRVLHAVASPSIAYLLLCAGLALLVFELFTGGVGVAGGTGGVCLVLAAFGLTVLPTSPLGIGLLVLGTFGLAVDVQTGAPRVWTGIGVVGFAVGSVLLFDDGVRAGWIALVAGFVGFLLVMLSALPATIRSRYSTPTIGRGSMVGAMGEVLEDVAPQGVVEVDGAPWPARTNRATPVRVGDRVRVVAIDGIYLEVEPEEGGARDYRDRAKAGNPGTDR